MNRIFFLLSCCGISLLPLVSAADERVEYRGGIELGYGYDAFTGNFTTPCYMGAEKSHFYGASRGTFEWSEAESHEDLQKKLSISVSAAYKSLGSSAEGKASFLNTYNSSIASVNIVARHRIESGFYSLQDATLRSEIADKVMYGKKIDPLKLREACGTHYVQAIITGGELYAVLSQFIRSETEREEFSTVASASKAAFSGSIKNTSELESSRYSKTVNVTGGYAGGSGTTPISPKVLREEFTELRTKIEKLAAQEAIQKTRLTPPIEILLAEIRYTGEDADKMAALGVALRKELSLTTYQRALETIRTSPSLFNVDSDNLSIRSEQIEKRLQEHIGRIRSQMRQCAQATGSKIKRLCDFSSYPLAPNIRDSGLPKPFQEDCAMEWTPRSFTSEFAGIPRVAGDSSMGGGDTVFIDTKYGGPAQGALQQETTLRIYESTHRTVFEKKLSRTFFDPNMQPRPGCYLTAPVNITQQPGTINLGNNHNDYRRLYFDTQLVTTATCRSNQPGGDDGYVGCNAIDFRPINLPRTNIEKLFGPKPISIQMPTWLIDR